jgi:hypothetical protein
MAQERGTTRFPVRDAFYEKHFPREEWVEEVLYLDFVALAEHGTK